MTLVASISQGFRFGPLFASLLIFIRSKTYIFALVNKKIILVIILDIWHLCLDCTESTSFPKDYWKQTEWKYCGMIKIGTVGALDPAQFRSAV